MSTLKAQAEALGIKVHGNWSDETLQRKIDEAKAESGPDLAPILNEGPSAEAALGAPVSDEGEKLKSEATPKSIRSGLPSLDAKTRLIITAQELNVDVDEDWDEDRLRGEIQMAREGRGDLQVKGAVPPKEYSDENFDPMTRQSKTGVPLILERDYWTEEDTRVAAGTEIYLPAGRAAELINKGVARRNDPLPS